MLKTGKELSTGFIPEKTASILWDFADGRVFYNAHVIKQNLRLRLKGPSAEHIFGLDEFGRDMFLRMLWGIRYSLFMGMASITEFS